MSLEQHGATSTPVTGSTSPGRQALGAAQALQVPPPEGAELGGSSRPDMAEKQLCHVPLLRAIPPGPRQPSVMGSIKGCFLPTDLQLVPF